ncbi:hypothetical protein DESPIG_00767 [Desulfovibrio piger ATCC 29098]|uniref:Uncharacterized protein n=1 Tax=Desulfovibrio piger ATCC 29098 TaxID=411464 RepID=B6WRS6_9BACT|nr:hypothetical protein DESPIG_00767 [Desulfovibrio piger ATCC 29098]
MKGWTPDKQAPLRRGFLWRNLDFCIDNKSRLRHKGFTDGGKAERENKGEKNVKGYLGGDAGNLTGA